MTAEATANGGVGPLTIGVPVPEGFDRPDPEARFTVTYHPGGTVGVYHPLHGDMKFGDQSTMPTKASDMAAVVLLTTMPYLIDSMKLNRPAEYATRPFAGEYCQLSHCISLGVLAMRNGGDGMAILNALFNDAAHIYDGHQGDDNYGGHGQEDFHDRQAASFLQRAGIVDALLRAGVLRRTPDGVLFGDTRLAVPRLLDETEANFLVTFLNNKHRARRLDADRAQYSAEEQILVDAALNQRRGLQHPARAAIDLARQEVENPVRMTIVEGNEGDQLVFTRPDVARRAAINYANHNALHWCEPVQDLVSDLLNLAERYFFLADYPVAKNFQEYYPRDYTHTAASLMFHRFEQVAKDDPVMRWILRTASRIAADQRGKALEVLDGTREYDGPRPPEGVAMRKHDWREKLAGLLPSRFRRTRHAFDVGRGQLHITLPRGKVRTLMPRVADPSGKTTPLDEIYPDLPEQNRALHRWIGDYTAHIDIAAAGDEFASPEFAERLRKAMTTVREEWPKALRLRPPMPDEVLRASIREANEYVLQAGAIGAAVMRRDAQQVPAVL